LPREEKHSIVSWVFAMNKRSMKSSSLGRRLLAAPAAALRAVVGERLRLDVARVREGHHTSSEAIRSSICRSSACSTISLFLLSPYCAFSAFSSSEMIPVIRAGWQACREVRDFLDQFLLLGDDLVLLQPVRRARRISRIACACASDSL